jgi:hypothetical protein
VRAPASRSADRCGRLGTVLVWLVMNRSSVRFRQAARHKQHLTRGALRWGSALDRLGSQFGSHSPQSAPAVCSTPTAVVSNPTGALGGIPWCRERFITNQTNAVPCRPAPFADLLDDALGPALTPGQSMLVQDRC